MLQTVMTQVVPGRGNPKRPRYSYNSHSISYDRDVDQTDKQSPIRFFRLLKMLLSAERRLLNAAFLTALIFFMVISMHIFHDVDNKELLSINSQSRSILSHHEQSATVNPEPSRPQRNFALSNITREPKSSNKTASHEKSNEVLSFSPSNEYLRHEVTLANERQKIRNLDKFDLSFDESAIVIVVQVHNRSAYLRHLVDSLNRSKDIGDVLLIFSHDVYSVELNDIIEKIDFCLVMQIFYPFSIQLHSKEFPGNDPRDCPKTATKQSALKMGCQNANDPDRFGHYREASFTQPKHHWFWKMNHVFDHLKVTEHFEGLVLFLEEDHYAVEDFLHVLKLTYRLQKRFCSDCRILTLGGYDDSVKRGEDLEQVSVMSWKTSKHNIGMAFDRTTWQRIRACGNAFCNYDDYNWDWSLHNIGVNCIPLHLKALVVKTPRILHIGECGMHIKRQNCSPLKKIDSIERTIQRHRSHLFPERLRIGQVSVVQLPNAKVNGGWGDPRDRKLCKSFMNESTH